MLVLFVYNVDWRGRENRVGSVSNMKAVNCQWSSLKFNQHLPDTLNRMFSLQLHAFNRQSHPGHCLTPRHILYSLSYNAQNLHSDLLTSKRTLLHQNRFCTLFFQLQNIFRKKMLYF